MEKPTGVIGFSGICTQCCLVSGGLTLLYPYGHIVAERLFFHVISVDRIGPGPAAAADVDVLAGAALSLVRLEIPQILENFRIFPNLPEGGLLDIAGGAVEVGAGLDVAEAVDEADGLGRDAPFAAAGGEGEAPPLECDPLGLGLLGDDPVVVGGAGGRMRMSSSIFSCW